MVMKNAIMLIPATMICLTPVVVITLLDEGGPDAKQAEATVEATEAY